MCFFAKQLVESKVSNNLSLNVEERNLLSVAYKNVVGGKRAVCRILSGMDTCEGSVMDKYKQMIENEIKLTCNEVLMFSNLFAFFLAESVLKLASRQKDDAEVFYLKIIYQKSSECYEKAKACIKENFRATHPFRLGLALSWSVFCYEILKDPENAYKIAKEAFDAAIGEIETLNDQESILLMQLLRDNISLWTQETTE
ncbi:tyrosine 3-monooxygenase [Reticulomyxa filosa]|uniref:Tyrosine 3-monooxygenase n=1 Tax=Reticulomyxa filosa TaxID=46433 RepID=X6LVU5_RETFI|nr:tyrosine 3-monooxygenase [Reticulomyxa filosa]|eukprot:ETO06058.1 tyrosine 3-monooxygenase [Reticulomyxa filosa]